MAYTRLTLADLWPPCFTNMNSSNGSRGNLESAREFGLRNNAVLRTDIVGLVTGQFRSIQPMAGAMYMLIGFVFQFRCPAKVARICASLIALSATVRGFMKRCWRLAMSKNAHRTGRRRTQAAKDYSAVAVATVGERPRQTFVRRVVRVVNKPLLDASRRHSPSKRVSMPYPARIVGLTPASGAFRFPVSVFVAAFDSACFVFVSHLRSIRDRLWSEPTYARQRRVGSPLRYHELAVSGSVS